MAFFWKKKEEKKEREWNLDFLTQEEKSSINVVFELAEGLSANGPESAKEALRTAKKRYLADMGYGDSDEGYTKADITLIAIWTGTAQKMMAEMNSPVYREPLRLLTQVKQKMIDNGLIEDLAGAPIPTVRDKKDLSFLLPAEKNVVRIALDAVINTQYYNEAKLGICKQARTHLLTGEAHSADEFRFMGWSLEVLIDILRDKAGKASGSDLEKYQSNLNLAMSALKKIRS